MSWVMGRFAVLLVGLWVAFAPGLVAPPMEIMGEQVMLSGHSHSGDACCCPDDSTESGVCPLRCVNMLPMATAPGNEEYVVIASPDRGSTAPLGRPGRTFPPDPPPPKRTALS